MYTFTGEYEVKVDAKGRIKLPVGLLKQLGEGALDFVVNRGFEKHLMMYPQDVWKKKTTEINQLNIYNTKQRQAIRYFYRGATEVSTDATERILLPKSLVEYAGIDKDAVLFAYHEQIEIWSKEEYDKMLNSEPENFSQIADEIFGTIGGNYASDNI